MLYMWYDNEMGEYCITAYFLLQKNRTFTLGQKYWTPAAVQITRQVNSLVK